MKPKYNIGDKVYHIDRDEIKSFKIALIELISKTNKEENFIREKPKDRFQYADIQYKNSTHDENELFSTFEEAKNWLVADENQRHEDELKRVAKLKVS